MSHVATNQPEGTPTWIDLGIPDLDRAMRFYGALFGWDFEVGPGRDRPLHACGSAAGPGRRRSMPNPDPDADGLLVERLPRHRRL